MKSLFDRRAANAKWLANFYLGLVNTHPSGLSGTFGLFLPPEDDRRCWDTSPGGYSCSEWGNAAGMVP